MPRSARKTAESGIYYIFANGEFSKLLTRDSFDKIQLINLIFKQNDTIPFDVYAFTVTNNELHLVIKEFKPLQISEIMKNVFSAYSTFYNNKYATSGSLLHDRFKSIPLETDEDVRLYVRYVHQAPVKLLEYPNVFTYKFSSYNEYFSDFPKVEIEPVLNRFDGNTQMARTKFKIYHAGVELSELKGTLRLSLSKEELAEILLAKSTVSLEQYKTMPRTQKYEVAKVMKKKSKLSYRQLETLLGISRSTIAKL